jgi:hypothetical protein
MNAPHLEFSDMKTATVFLYALLVALAASGVGKLYAAPVNYDEAINGDLDQSNPPTFTLDAGDNVWKGKLGPTPTTNTQDSFFANLPAGLEITHIHWVYSSNRGDQSSFDMSGPPAAAPPFGTVVSHNVKSAGDNITDSGFSIVNPILPITVTGQYKCEATTNFSITEASWQITLTVEAIPSPAGPSTWGRVKALYNN